MIESLEEGVRCKVEGVGLGLVQMYILHHATPRPA